MGLLPSLPPRFSTLPGSSQRRRALAVVAVALLVWALRPLWPFAILPGWVVGGLLLWAVVELVRWAWWPRRSA
jgi:MFS superfamily sulfate permease-like transporter